ncbi:RHS repeat-associated core domain-containing protein [Massilia antarctica]|uniref:RHS repeat-associated core domain-containing protein n=1 Tax=Massilia antarctica TaxID=2765360 RepID=UPI002271905D|nr:RHS repeat-associated core domain-containing protein [Massilia sp. H27-R4]MCY0912409.1 PAAR domain-containing protein [Massilia sp. H27-R4]
MGAAAGRVDDPIAHSHAMGGLIAGLVIGALVGAAIIATGGLALVAVAGAVAVTAGAAGVGEVVGSMNVTDKVFGANLTGVVKTGSLNVFANGQRVARAHLDIAICATHGPAPQLVVQGSSTVFVNGQPFARVGDLISCSAKIHAGSPNVFVGGATATTDRDLIKPEVPGWVHTTLLVAGLASATVLAGPLVALGGLALGMLGGEVGGYVGGMMFGEGSDGQKAMMLGGSLLGGMAGAKGGAWLGNKFIPNPTTPAMAFVKGGVPAASKFNPAKERPDETICKCGDPIDVVTGNVILEQTDFALAGALPIVLRRLHTSGNPSGTVFGKAWASTWGQWIEVNGDAELVFHAEDGASMRFDMPEPGAKVTHGVYQAYSVSRLDGHFLVERRHQPSLRFEQRDATHWHLSAITDRNANRIALIYDGAVLSEVRHSGGTRLKVEASEHAITRISLLHADGAQTTLASYTYHADGELSAIVNSSGLPLTYTYDGAHRLTRWQDRNGVWIGYRYDARGRCEQTSGGGGGHMTGGFVYDDARKVNTYTDSLGHATEYHYNDDYQVIKEVDARGGVSQFDFDTHCNLVAAITPGGAVLRWAYDARGNMVGHIDASGKETVVAYNQRDLPVAVTSPDGTRIERGYDERGNLVQVGGSGAWTRFEHDAQGNVLRVVNPAGAQAAFTHDERGLPTSVTDWLGNPTRLARDAFGRVTARTDPQQHTSHYAYNVEGLPLEITLPGGSRHLAKYDPEGNCIARTDALGNVTRHAYGAFDRLTQTTEANGAVTRYEYDTELRLSAVVNPMGERWSYLRNATGQVIAETDFAGRTVQYEVDADGLVIGKRTPSGQHTRYLRNHAGQLLEQVASEGSTRYTYDVLGRLDSAVNADSDIRFERDAQGRVVRETQNGRSIVSGYDLMGRRTERSSSGGHSSVWEFNANSLPLELTLPDAQMFSFLYDSGGRETGRQLPGGARIEQEYDPLNRLTRQWTGIAADKGRQARTLQERAVNYDGNGNPHKLGERSAGVIDIGYDKVGRVTQASRGNGGEQYAYDLAGNLVDAIKQKSLLDTDEGNADTRGQRLHQRGKLMQAGKVKYEYDLEGRVTTRIEGKRWGRQQHWHYIWNSENRLKRVITPDGDAWEYTYDALGRRLTKKQVPSDRAARFTEVEYLWDGHTVAEERRFGRKPDGKGGLDLIEEICATWDYEPDSFRPLAKTETIRRKGKETSKTYAVVLDHIGTPKELIDADGVIAWQARSDLWGEIEETTVSQTDCPIRFQGQYYDAESKLAYNWHRYYDASTGRYLTPDPLGLAGGPNPYAYVDNPLSSIDPLGLMDVCTTEDGSLPGKKYRPEASLSNSPAKQHGIKWGYNEAQNRARTKGNLQGQFGSKADVEYAIAEARKLPIGERVVIEAPEGTLNILHLPTGGTKPATHIFIEVQPAGAGGGSIHAFPVPKNYPVTPRTTKIKT